MPAPAPSSESAVSRPRSREPRTERDQRDAARGDRREAQLDREAEMLGEVAKQERDAEEQHDDADARQRVAAGEPRPYRVAARESAGDARGVGARASTAGGSEASPRAAQRPAFAVRALSTPAGVRSGRAAVPPAPSRRRSAPRRPVARQAAARASPASAVRASRCATRRSSSTIRDEQCALALGRRAGSATRGAGTERRAWAARQPACAARSTSRR